MARGKAGPRPEPDAQTAAQVEEARPQAELPGPRARQQQKRVQIPVDDAGRIAWANMRESTREETRKFVTQLLNDRELAASLGLEKPAMEVFPQKWIDALYDSVGTLEVALAPRLFGVSSQVASQVFPFSQLEKDKLCQPTAAVISKYAADWMIRFKEEIALAMLLTTMTYTKIMMAKMAQQKMDEMNAQPVRANGPEKKEMVT